MRRKDREVTEPADLAAILADCKVCRVAYQDEQGLTIVPLNYGYRYDEGQLTLYFHSARAGRKVTAFERGCEVAFELDGGHELVYGQSACQYSYHYHSIVGNGWMMPVPEAKRMVAMEAIVSHQTGQALAIDQAMLEKTQVYQLEAVVFSGKRHC